MSYTKTVWINGETALSDTNLNHIETGVKDAHDALDNVYTKTEVDAKIGAKIVVGTGQAPTTGTPNSLYVQIVSNEE